MKRRSRTESRQIQTVSERGRLSVDSVELVRGTSRRGSKYHLQEVRISYFNDLKGRIDPGGDSLRHRQSANGLRKGDKTAQRSIIHCF